MTTAEQLRADQITICEFMEPSGPLLEKIAKYGDRSFLEQPHPEWWFWVTRPEPTVIPILERCPEIEKLGRLHEVEARLSAAQKIEYDDRLLEQVGEYFWHADATTKTRALAEVLGSR